MEISHSKIQNQTLILVFTLLTIFFSQAIFSIKVKSPTYDESYHLTSGYLSITTGDFHYGAAHPPLMKSLAAVPLLFMEISLPENIDTLLKMKWESLGRHFVFKPGNDADKIFFLARLSLMFIAVILGFYIFLWARNLYGENAGLMALVLYTFSPNILAHARLVTTDFGATCFIFISCFHFWLYINQPSFKKLCVSGLFFGLALASKFSALILFPILFLMVFSKALASNSSGIFENVFNDGERKLSKKISLFIKNSLVFILVAYMVLILAYGLRFDAILLYMEGLELLKEQYFNVPDRYLNYSLGEYSVQPKWYYPFITVFVKTPVPLFILFVLVIGLSRKRISKCINEVSLLIPIAIIFIVSLFDNQNAGLRRLLPMYPFIFVLVAKLVHILENSEYKNTGISNKQVLVPTSIFLILWYIVSSTKTFPDYLTYFNEFAGGPKGGIYYLDNSNIDLGQDLKRLKFYMDDQRIEKIKLQYFGTADPNYYGIKWEPLTEHEKRMGPQPGYCAISINYLNKILRIPSEIGFGEGWNKNYEPIKIIGNTIYIFKFS